MNAYLIILLAALIAALFGANFARRRGGRPLDLVQYGAVFAILGAILATLATVLMFRIV